MMMCSCLHPLLRFLPCLCLDHGPSPCLFFMSDNPVLSTIIWSGFPKSTPQLRMGLRVMALRERVVWSGVGRLSFIIDRLNATKPSVWRNGRWKRSLKERAVSMAISEYFLWLPRLPVGFGVQALIASFENQRVISPLFRKDWSYFDQSLDWWVCFL